MMDHFSGTDSTGTARIPISTIAGVAIAIHTTTGAFQALPMIAVDAEDAGNMIRTHAPGYELIALLDESTLQNWLKEVANLKSTVTNV